MHSSRFRSLARAVAVLAVLLPVVASAQQVVKWGSGPDVSSDAQSGVAAIAAGYEHSLALLTNGGVVGWGSNSYGQATVPSEAWSGVASVAAGSYHSLALKSNGTLLAWGRNDYGQITLPSDVQSGVSAISAGAFHSLALKGGAVLAWGRTDYGQCNVPVAARSDVARIATGFNHSLALKSDGSVVAWGYNGQGQCNVPVAAQSGVIAIAGGGNHSLALKADGSVVAWGNNLYGQCNVPTAAQSGVTAIAGGTYHSLALKSDGSVVAWGYNSYGQCNVPVAAQSGVGAISASGYYSLALRTLWISFAPSTVYSGDASMATVHIDSPAPTGGLVLPLTSDDPAVHVPESVTVTGGATEATFPVTTDVTLGSDRAAAVRFTYNGMEVASTFTVKSYSASLTLSPSIIGTGDASTGTIRLGSPAPTGGITFALTSNDTGVHVPETATVPAGATEVAFPIAADVTFGPQRTADIRFAYGSYFGQRPLTIRSRTFSASFNLPGIVVGSNQALTLTLKIGSSFTNDVRFLLSGPTGLRLPRSVVIPAGQTSLAVPLVPNGTVPLGGVTATVAYKETPLASVPLNTNPMQAAVLFDEAKAIGGVKVTARVRLNESTRDAVKVLLASDNAAAKVPASVTVPAGAREATFVVTTTPVTDTQKALVSATLNGITNKTTLQVIANSVIGMTFSPASVKGGQNVTATVTLKAASPTNTIVTLASNDPTLAKTPNKVIVLAGQLTANFTITTKATTAAKTAQIIATLGTSITRNLKVVP